MPDIPQTCKCLDPEDKRLILKIIDEVIEGEMTELRKIEIRRLRTIAKPPFVEQFGEIRSSLKRVHEDFKKSVEELKRNIKQYPKCSTIIKEPIVYIKGSATDIKVNVSYSKSEMPVPFSQRKLF
jgi:hypothetical protein